MDSHRIRTKREPGQLCAEGLMATATMLLLLLLTSSMASLVFGFESQSEAPMFHLDTDLQAASSPPPPPSPSASAVFVLGDSSVDCGDNTLLYPILHRNLSLLPCNGSDSTLFPHLLAKKIGFDTIPTFYSQNGSVDTLMTGLNFGSAEASLVNLNPHQSHQSLDQQLRQAFETIQLLQLHLGPSAALRRVRSAVFLLSFGRDDYAGLLLSSRRTRLGLDGHRFAAILVRRVASAIRDLYDAGVRRVVTVGVMPLGCAPRMVWMWHNLTGGGDGCVDGINQLVVDYNAALERRVAELDTEMPDARIVFCDAYQGIADIISNPNYFGFEDVRNACCGKGRYGGMSGCASMELACDRGPTHVWWDFYNPTQAVNSLLADSAWSGQPLPDLCRPATIEMLVSTSASPVT